MWFNLRIVREAWRGCLTPPSGTHVLTYLHRTLLLCSYLPFRLRVMLLVLFWPVNVEGRQSPTIRPVLRGHATPNIGVAL
jgi:hypothetical protein